MISLDGVHAVVPLARTRGERFDDLVLEAVQGLEQRWGAHLTEVEFAVEDVPPVPLDPGSATWDENVVLDETPGGAVPLGQLLPATDEQPPRVVVYRRPLEARAGDRHELSELVHEVVVDQVARLLSLDPDEIDPGR